MGTCNTRPWVMDVSHPRYGPSQSLERRLFITWRTRRHLDWRKIACLSPVSNTEKTLRLSVYLEVAVGIIFFFWKK